MEIPLTQNFCCGFLPMGKSLAFVRSSITVLSNWTLLLIVLVCAAVQPFMPSIRILRLASMEFLDGKPVR